jgi:hypothetical protein
LSKIFICVLFHQQWFAPNVQQLHGNQIGIPIRRTIYCRRHSVALFVWAQIAAIFAGASTEMTKHFEAFTFQKWMVTVEDKGKKFISGSP